MKYLLPLLLLSAKLFSAPEMTPQSEMPPLPQITAYEPSLIKQEPISLDQTKIPEPVFQPKKKSTLLTMGLSVVPGLGHVYLGEYQTASGLLGTTALSVGLQFYPNESVRFSNDMAFSDFWGYGVYAAYRDLRKVNGFGNYKYRMPQDSLFDLAYASFNWKVLKKPEVWGGFLGTFVFLSVWGKLEKKLEGSFAAEYKEDSVFYRKEMPYLAFSTGVGEESLFRGYIQSQLAEYMPPWAAILTTSLGFAAVHIPNAKQMATKEERKRYYMFGLPYIACLGAYFGWMVDKNHSLKEAVALHAWYDFVLFCAAVSYAKNKEASLPGRYGFAYSVPF